MGMATSALSRFNSLSSFNIAISWRELLRRTAKDSLADDAFGLAAQLAYYFFLSLFPALLAIVALASFFPLYNFTDNLSSALAQVAPAAVLQVLTDQLTKLSNGNHVSVFSIGVLMAIWSSSAAMVSIIEAMNRAYDITESRPWWRMRLTAILLTTGLAFFILTSFTLVLAGRKSRTTSAGISGSRRCSRRHGRFCSGRSHSCLSQRVSALCITTRRMPSRNGCGSRQGQSQRQSSGSCSHWPSGFTS